MKHRHLVMGSVLILTLDLGGCTWDSSLYDTYARNDSVTRCPPGDLLTDAEGEKYIDLSTADCYKDEIKFKSGGDNTYSLLKNEADGQKTIWQCVDAEQNCKAGVADCENCPAWIEDYRMCMAFQDFEGLFEKDNDTMPSIDFIADDRPTKNLRYHYAEAGKYRICPKDYNTCYYHKPDGLERGQFGCVSDCPLSMIDPNTGKCQFSCSQNTCRIGNKCENQDQACGRDCVNCTTKSDDPNAKSYKCNKHVACTVKTCQLGYHLKSVGDDQYVCEANKDYLCGTVNSHETFDCSEATHDPNASSYKCNKHGACTVKTCQRGYHLKAVGDDQYACEANTDDLCGAVDSEETSDCSIFDANDEIYRCHSNGHCTVDKCQIGYHLIKTEKENQYKCEANADNLCGAVDAEAEDCSNFDDYDEIYRCHSNGHCTVDKCQRGYHLIKTEKENQYACEANTAALCGAVDSIKTSRCSDVEHSTGECDQDGLCACKNYSQASSYDCYCTVNNNYYSNAYNESYCSCLPKRLDNGLPYCMKQVWCNGVACHEKDGWLTGECVYSSSKYHCKAKSCQKGYHQKKIEFTSSVLAAECERNTDEACGLATTSNDTQLKKYPINCKEKGATCNKDVGLCYDSDRDQYWCQPKNSPTYSLDWRALSNCYL